MKTWHLSVSTFRGLVPGAVHYFGRIRGRENGESDPLFSEIVLEQSDGSTNYLTVGALRAAAYRWFRKNASSDDMLIDGSHGSIDPREVLLGPSDVKKKANAIWRRFEKLDGWEIKENWDRTKSVCDEWDRLLSGKIT